MIKMVLAQRSLHETEDAIIVEVLNIDPDGVTVLVETEIGQKQRDLFRHIGENKLDFSIRSSLARLGFDYETEGTQTPSLERNRVAYSVKIVKYTNQFLPNGTSIGDLFVPNVTLGRFYIDDPETYVHEEIQDRLTDGRATAEGGRYLKEDGVLMLPFPKRIIKPNSNYSEDVLRGIINNSVPSSSLQQYLSPEDVEDIYVRRGQGILTNPWLTTGELEVIVLDSDVPGVNHTKARFGSSGRQLGEFYIELFGDNGEVPVKEIGIRLLYPVFPNTNV